MLKSHAIDVLVEGPDGELIFKTVYASKDDITELMNTKDTFVKHNIEKELKEKKIWI